jgi:hypothetical protein
MIHFHDNDVIFKMAGCDLLQQLPELLEVPDPTKGLAREAAGLLVERKDVLDKNSAPTVADHL